MRRLCTIDHSWPKWVSELAVPRAPELVSQRENYLGPGRERFLPGRICVRHFQVQRHGRAPRASAVRLLPPASSGKSSASMSTPPLIDRLTCITFSDWGASEG